VHLGLIRQERSFEQRLYIDQMELSREKVMVRTMSKVPARRVLIVDRRSIGEYTADFILSSEFFVRLMYSFCISLTFRY
jgi:hypothetical protein